MGVFIGKASVEIDLCTHKCVFPLSHWRKVDYFTDMIVQQWRTFLHIQLHYLYLRCLSCHLHIMCPVSTNNFGAHSHVRESVTLGFGISVFQSLRFVKKEPVVSMPHVL